MINDCIRIGIKDDISSMRRLCLASYHALAKYPAVTYYRLTAISRAAGILRNYRKTRGTNLCKVPYAKRLMLTDCYGFRIQGNRLRITLRENEYIYIELNPHTLAAMKGCVARSVTLTPTVLTIAYAKELEEMALKGRIGVDRNLDNVTAASSDATIQIFDLSKATEIKMKYRHVKSHVKRNDARIMTRVFRKYGALQRNRVGWILNNVSSSIVSQAKEKQFGIVLENLKGLRAVSQRQRSRELPQSSPQLVELLRDTKTDRIQGKVGGNTCCLCSSKRNIRELLDMWVENIPE